MCDTSERPHASIEKIEREINNKFALLLWEVKSVKNLAPFRAWHGRRKLFSNEKCAKSAPLTS